MSGLLRQLGSSDPGESSRAAAELGERGDPSAVGWLIAALGHPHARIAAVIALGKLRDERAVEPLIAVLRDSSGPSSDAAKALAAIGSPRALQAVADEIYSVHPSALPDVFRAFRAKGKRIVPLLTPLVNSPSPPIKEGARAVLREVGWVPAGSPEERTEFSLDNLDIAGLKAIGQPAVDHLRGMLLVHGGRSRMLAAYALGKLGWKPENDDERVAALLAMGETRQLALSGFATVERLAAALSDPNEDVCRTAAQALGEKGDRRAVEPLIAALQSGSKMIRKEAAIALGAIKDRRAVEPLIASLAHFRPERSWSDLMSEFDRTAAIEVLREFGGPFDLSPLLASLIDQDESVRSRAASALARLPDAQAVEPLIAALSDEDDNVRDWAAVALGYIADPRAVEPLVAVLNDETRKGRSSAAQALGRIADPRAVPRLVTALKDIDQTVRQHAADALGAIADPRAIQPLVETAARCAPHSMLSDNAVWAIEKIDQPAVAVEALMSIVNRKTEKTAVRLRAARLVRELVGGPLPTIKKNWVLSLVGRLRGK
jgi:HEAT repeat protein